MPTLLVADLVCVAKRLTAKQLRPGAIRGHRSVLEDENRVQEPHP